MHCHRKYECEVRVVTKMGDPGVEVRKFKIVGTLRHDFRRQLGTKLCTVVMDILAFTLREVVLTGWPWCLQWHSSKTTVDQFPLSCSASLSA